MSYRCSIGPISRLKLDALALFREACIRCPVLRVDPSQRERLAGIIANLRDRITEAQQQGWLGEVEGLRTSLSAASTKLAALDRSARRDQQRGPTALGMPLIRR